MADRVTVNFFHQDIPGLDPQWAWFDASGHTPAVGDYIITPSGKQWKVLARSWQQHREGLHCNVAVTDYHPDTPEPS